jgi:hypothetical protein
VCRIKENGQVEGDKIPPAEETTTRAGKIPVGPETTMKGKELIDLEEEMAELIRNFKPDPTRGGCYYCGSHMNFDKDADDLLLLVREILKRMGDNDEDER